MSTFCQVLLTLFVLLSLTACQAIPLTVPTALDTIPQEHATPHVHVAPLLGNLGNHTFPITTNSELAQQYFNEGLILTYGFNHAEAIRSFKDALQLDPACAMCYWGIAYALGPNINAPMEAAAVPEAWAALEKALELAPNAGETEQAYIAALATRYSADPNADRAALDKAYADAMRELAQVYPDDLEAATLFADALMNLSPWNYWTKEGEPTEYTQEIVSTLESVLARNPDHPAANHFYIHAVEASQTPERALPSADRLTHLVPGAGHLVHMPAHVYWRVGRYADAITANEHAIHSDESYIPDYGAQGLYVVGYYPHNYHFLSAAAQMAGNRDLALDSARKMAAQMPADLVAAVPPFQDRVVIPLLALVRFGQWDEILAEPEPSADQGYTTGIWHWARGMAYVNTGEVEKAETQYETVMALAQSDAMKTLGFFSFSTAAQNLTLAGHILAAEIAAAKGNVETQIDELEAAVQIQDSMAYIEPPAWYFPVRQMLGAALLDAGRAAEAEAVYREDLRQYPHNGWSLFGLMQSLKAQGKPTDAVEQEFTTAWENADVTLERSRF